MSAFIAESKMRVLTKSFIMCLVIVALTATQSYAQFGNNNNFGSVIGGVEIDANGVLSGKMQVLPKQLRDQLQARLNSANDDINKASKLRVISLRGLEAAIRSANESGQPLPSEVQFMAGLQRIESGNQNVLLIWRKNDVFDSL